MIELKVIKHSPKTYTDYTDNGMPFRATRDVKKDSVITGETLIDCFRKFERANNRLRYCNGYFFEIADAEKKKEFSNWYKSLSRGEQMDLYYGGGIVD